MTQIMTNKWTIEIDRLRADLALNASMLARQTDLAREAETERNRLRAENESLKKNAQELHDKYGRLWDDNAALLKRNQSTYCAFCGEFFEADADPDGRKTEAVQEHIKNCTKHPMRELEKDNAALLAALKDAKSTIKAGQCLTRRSRKRRQ